MKITHLHGQTVGLGRQDEISSSGESWRLLLIDGDLSPDGELIPGTGTGESTVVYLFEQQVAMLHEQSESASPIVRPVKKIHRV